MKPINKPMTFEKIKTDDFVTGTIEDIVYDKEHVFKGFNGAPDSPPQLGVRFVFNVDGYKFPHKTPWLKMSYSAKSNLFKKYISSLVQGAKEYMDFDLDQLKGMRVKLLWIDNGDFQGVETIRPLDAKIIPVNGAVEGEDAVPF